MQIFFRDGTSTDRIAVEYPIGHRRRRKDGIPLLLAKFDRHLRGQLPPAKADAILALCGNASQLEKTPVDEFMAMLAI
jgi:2-methylcitrate dehydratase